MLPQGGKIIPFLENTFYFLSYGEWMSSCQDLLRERLSFQFILECSFISVGSLVSWSIHLDFLARMLVFKEDPTDKFSVFHVCRFVWVVQSCQMILIDPGLGGVRSLSSIHFFTFTVDAVCMV
jgi:hypothetical protein